MAAPKPIKKVAEFIAAVEAIVFHWGMQMPFWFRGHADSSWELVPKLFRFERPDETALRIDFERVGVELLNGRTPSDHWEWYFLAQHYGVPTRLLDWTEGALLALYFALRERKAWPDQGTNASVWMLDPKWLNRRSGLKPFLARPTSEVSEWLPLDPADKVDASSPLAIVPPYVARRLAVQRSQFVLFGTERRALSDLHTDPNNRLAKFEIFGPATDFILGELLLLGISETTLFPDLEGLARELEGKFAGKKIVGNLQSK